MLSNYFYKIYEFLSILRVSMEFMTEKWKQQKILIKNSRKQKQGEIFNKQEKEIQWNTVRKMKNVLRWHSIYYTIKVQIM